MVDSRAMQKPALATPPGESARTAGRTWLRQALQDSRRRTLSLYEAFESGLSGSSFKVPLSAELNPPLWELGHIGWFQDWWIARNRQRALGLACDPDHVRSKSRLPEADAFYDSSNVAHDIRWSLPLPDAPATRRYLQQGIDETLELLDTSAEDDSALYFFRLALLHEDMHCEAAVYMAQSLGLAMPAASAFPKWPGADTRGPSESSVRISGCDWQLGRAPNSNAGFAFDNEEAAQITPLNAFRIDTNAVSWARYLPFVDSAGYEESRWWSPEGWKWRTGAGMKSPRFLRKRDGEWQQQIFGNWQSLDPSAPALHLTLYEAQAWCRWAGRRLPTEAEWECAVMSDARIRWGDMWEWTASPFLPFPGFTPHPYRDYSAPWFGSRQVLRGASRATASNLVHPKYRNFFTPDRNDIYAGFRSCSDD